MKKPSRAGSFLTLYLFHLAIRFYLTVPGWILLILHFIIPQYIRWWYCLAYFGAFLLYVLIRLLILRAIGRWVSTAEPAPPIPNRNPYSSKGYVPYSEQKKRD